MIGQIALTIKPCVVRTFLTAVFAFIISLTFVLPAFSQTSPLKIQSVSYQAEEHRILITAQDGSEFKGEFPTVRLTNPERLIVDIPQALLSTSNRNVSVQQNGIERIELSQSLGTFYQVVRITIYGSQASAFSNIQVKPSQNTLQVLLANNTTLSQTLTQPPLPPTTMSSASLTASGKNVLKAVYFDNDRLILEAESGHALVIKNQFTLTGPSRLVVDFGNTVLADRKLTTPLNFTSGHVKTIRLGQFDEDTVRLVIETSRPNSLYLVYPESTKHKIALSSQLGQSVRSLPAESQRVGFIQDIHLTKKNDASIIRISTTDPMVRRLVRNQDEIEVELINIAANPSFVAYDKQQFEDIKEIRLAPLNANEPNTRMIIKLNNAKVDMDSNLSMDGRFMEIMLTPKDNPRYHVSKGLPKLITPGDSYTGNVIDFPLPNLKKGQYTVVVDAGHGGKDLGANRDGVYEKSLNLSVALKLKQALEAKGINVHMTRSTDTFLELSQITAITNRIRPDAFVSVHTNASVNTSARGIETYYYTPQSRQLAQMIHRRAINSINSPDRGVRTARFYVIHHTSVPAILFEMGYISHPQEREDLQTESRQRATAEAIAQGVVEFLGRSLKAEATPEESF